MVTLATVAHLEAGSKCRRGTGADILQRQCTCTRVGGCDGWVLGGVWVHGSGWGRVMRG